MNTKRQWGLQTYSRCTDMDNIRIKARQGTPCFRLQPALHFNTRTEELS